MNSNIDNVSFASLLIKQSHSPSYGHGWIMNKDGNRWHPSRSQKNLLEGLSRKQGESWLLKRFRQMFH